MTKKNTRYPERVCLSGVLIRLDSKLKLQVRLDGIIIHHLKILDGDVFKSASLLFVKDETRGVLLCEYSFL